MLESAEKLRENSKDERKNILWEILYVVSICMSGEILEDQKVGHYNPDENQGNKVLKWILLLTVSQFIDDVASVVGIKRQLAD